MRRKKGMFPHYVGWTMTSQLCMCRAGPLICTESAAVEVKESEDSSSIDLNDWDSFCCRCKDGGALICCDGCNRAFHDKCHTPPIPKQLKVMIDGDKFSGKIYCDECQRAGKVVRSVFSDQRISFDFCL